MFGVNVKYEELKHAQNSQYGSLTYHPPLSMSRLFLAMLAAWHTNFHGPKRMNATDFGDPLTLPLAPPCTSFLWFLVKCLKVFLTKYLANS